MEIPEIGMIALTLEEGEPLQQLCKHLLDKNLFADLCTRKFVSSVECQIIYGVVIPYE